jgi:hypothetical protein
MSSPFAYPYPPPQRPATPDVADHARWLAQLESWSRLERNWRRSMLGATCDGHDQGRPEQSDLDPTSVDRISEDEQVREMGAATPDRVAEQEEEGDDDDDDTEEDDSIVGFSDLLDLIKERDGIDKSWFVERRSEAIEIPVEGSDTVEASRPTDIEDGVTAHTLKANELSGTGKVLSWPLSPLTFEVPHSPGVRSSPQPFPPIPNFVTPPAGPPDSPGSQDALLKLLMESEWEEGHVWPEGSGCVPDSASMGDSIGSRRLGSELPLAKRQRFV